MAVKEPGGRRIEQTIVIDAPKERVWSLLAGLDTWVGWNPLNTSGSGRLAVGETIDIVVALPGMKPQPARPTVVAVEPNAALRYATRGAGGLMRAHRYFLIEPQGPKRCVVRNGEIFSGPLGRLIALLLAKRIGEGMTQLNLALKAEAEKKV